MKDGYESKLLKERNMGWVNTKGDGKCQLTWVIGSSDRVAVGNCDW